MDHSILTTNTALALSTGALALSAAVIWSSRQTPAASKEVFRPHFRKSRTLTPNLEGRFRADLGDP